MKRIRLFFINVLLLVLVNLTMRTVSVSFNAYVSVKIGAEGMGLLTLVMSVYGLSVTLASSGVNLAAVRLTAEAAALRENGGASLRYGPLRVSSVMGACLLYSFLFGACASLLLFFSSSLIGSVLLGDVRTIPSLRVLALSLPAISLSSALAGYFTGMRKVYKNALVSLIEQGIKIFLTVCGLLILAPAGLEYACLAVVGGAALAEGASLLTAILLYLPDRGRRAGERRERRVSFPKHFSAVARVALPVAVGAYARQGLVSAEHLAIPWGLRKNGASSGEALADYGTLHGMVFPFLLFPSAVLSAFSGLLVPEIAASAAMGEKKRIRRISRGVLRGALLFGIGMAGIFAGFAWEFGLGLYDSVQAAKQIRLLAPLVPVMYLDYAVDGILKGLGEQLHSMKINLLDSAVSLVLVLFLVPRMGLSGYIITVFVCEVMNAVLSISHLLNVSGLKCRVWQWVFAPLLSVILSVSLTRFLASFALPFSAGAVGDAEKLILTVLLYFLLLFLSRSIRVAECRLAWRMLFSGRRAETLSEEEDFSASRSEAHWMEKTEARFLP